jgi:hypothetical protein
VTTDDAEALPAPTAQHARDVVAPLGLALAALNGTAPTLVDQWDPEPLALFVGLLQSRIAELRAIEAYSAHVLGERMDRAETRWDDGMRAVREPRYRETWAPDTAAVVTHDLTADGGERAEGARLMLKRLQEAARLDWRVGGVRVHAGAGLDELRRRERTHWAVKVSLPAGAASSAAHTHTEGS